MKKQLLISFFALLSLVCINAENNRTIRISTDNIDLILQVGENGRLYQTYLGKKLLYERDVRDFPWNVYAASDGSVSKRGWEVYSGSGNEDFFEPALGISHSDGNLSTILCYFIQSTGGRRCGNSHTVAR